MSFQPGSTSPYKDASFECGPEASMPMRELMSDRILETLREIPGQNGGQPPQFYAHGKYICETIRPGLQFLGCDIFMQEDCDITTTWPRCIYLTSISKGYSRSKIGDKEIFHPIRGTPHVVGLGQETEVRSLERGCQHVQMSGLMITPELFDRADASIQEALEPLKALMKPGIVQHSLTCAPLLRELLLKFRDAALPGSLGKLYRESLSMSALLELVALLSEANAAKPSAKLISRDIAYEAKALIEANPMGVTTVSGLAQKLGTNETTLRRSFKNTFGERLFDHARAQRLNRARDMVRQGHMQISEIAFSCGYSDPANFTHAYRKQFGCTPRADQN